MKRILIASTLFFICISTFAIEPIPQENVSKEFHNLNKLEAILINNPNLTIDSVIKEQPELLKDLGINSETKSSINHDDPLKPAGFPAFWWGFCLGVWGILIVYLITDNDKSALNKTVRGCITSAAVVVGFYAVIVIIGLAAAATSPY